MSIVGSPRAARRSILARTLLVAAGGVVLLLAAHAALPSTKRPLSGKQARDQSRAGRALAGAAAAVVAAAGAARADDGPFAGRRDVAAGPPPFFPSSAHLSAYWARGAEAPGAAQDADGEGTGGWANSYLRGKADQSLSWLAWSTSIVSPLRQCAADRFMLHGSIPALAVQELLLGRDAKGSAAPLGELAMNVTAHGLPCKKAQGGVEGCCEHQLSLRRGTTDFDVYKQVFQCHYLYMFYTIFEGTTPPQYILDAGANVGLSTVLFKLLWPEATVVSLEPDVDNYELLKINTQGLEGVHALNAGLWSKRSDIVMKASHGAWGFVFREAEKGEKGMPAYSVQDVADQMGIPGFDFVKIDIEGAEGMVFQPGADLSWIQKARLVSLEVHDFFGSYFGLEKEEISQRIDASFTPTGYTIVSDNEHILYLAPELCDSLAKLPPPQQSRLREAERRVAAAQGC